MVHLKGAIESGLVELQISKELFTVKRDLLIRKDDAINKIVYVSDFTCHSTLYHTTRPITVVIYQTI